MRYIAAIVAFLFAWACASAVADDKQMGKMPRKAAISSKGTAAGKGAPPSTPAVTQLGAPPAPTSPRAKPVPPPAGAPPTPPTPKPIVTRIATAMAELKAVDGKSVGRAVLTQTPTGVQIVLTLTGLPPGEHGFHVHAVGRCEPPFASAGPHFNPGNKKHGFFAREGHHAGDMSNLHIPEGGALTATIVNSDITLEPGKPNSVFHEGGTALVIHARFDDYLTDPDGNSGDPIACGVIK
jgi:superoxide dismutase, Cu-Zn family